MTIWREKWIRSEVVPSLNSIKCWRQMSEVRGVASGAIVEGQMSTAIGNFPQLPCSKTQSDY